MRKSPARTIGSLLATKRSSTVSTPDTIVLIHGFWVTPRSWEDWVRHYEARGYRVVAPGYPGFDVEVEALNADPSPIRRSRCRRSSSTSSPSCASSTAADPDGALRGRRIHPAPARPRLRRRGGRDQLGADGGRQDGAAVAAEVDVRRAAQPGEPSPGGRLHTGAVALRVRQHVQRGGVAARCTSATTSRPRAGSSGAACWRTSRRAIRRRGSTTATTTARRCCSSAAATIT